MLALFKVLTVLALSVAIVSADTHTCSHGTLQCCDKLHPPGSTSGVELLQDAGLNPWDQPSGQVGESCRTITPTEDTSDGQCVPVCCEKVYLDYRIGTGCLPTDEFGN